MRAIGLTLFVLAGCSGRYVPAEADGLTFEHAFLLATAGERPLEVSKVFALEDGASNGAPAEIDLDLDREALYLVGFTSRDLARQFPAFDPRRGDVVLMIDDAPASPQADPATGRVRLRPPSPATFRLIDEDPAHFEAVDAGDVPALSALALDIPYNPDSCDPGLEAVPFGAETSLIPNPSPHESTLIDVARLSEDRVLAMSRSGLFVVDRGDAPGALTATIAFTPIENVDPASGVAFALDWSASPLRAYVAVDTSSTGEPTLSAVGAIRVYDIDSTGRIEFVETATLADFRFRDLTLDGLGRLIAVGNGGGVVYRTPEGEYRRGPDVAVFVDSVNGPSEVQHILSLDGSALGPHYFASPFRLSVGDVLDSPIPFDELPTNTGRVLDFRGIDAYDDDFWAVSLPTRVYLRSRGSIEFGEVPLRLEPEFLPCAEGGGDYPLEMSTVGAIPGGAIVAPVCDALLFVRADGCTSTIRFPGYDVRVRDEDDSAIDVNGDWITIAGPLGSVWELVR